MTEQLVAKHPGGRPTKYIPDVIFAKAAEYIATCTGANMKLPTVEGLALALDVRTETLYQWAKEYPRFSDTLKKILEKQKVQLMDDGLYGGREVNPAMAIFLLKVNHAMKENDPLQQTNIQIVVKRE